MFARELLQQVFGFRTLHLRLWAMAYWGLVGNKDLLYIPVCIYLYIRRVYGDDMPAFPTNPQ